MLNVISSNVTEELEAHNNKTLFAPSALQWEGLIRLYEYWQWWLFLQGKSGDWKTWMLNLIHSPASVTRRVGDRASRPHAAPLGRAACIPRTRRKMLLLPLAPAPPCQPWTGCRWTCRTWYVRSWSRGGTAMLPRASSKVLKQVDPAVMLRGGKVCHLRSQLTYRDAKRLSDLDI